MRSKCYKTLYKNQFMLYTYYGYLYSDVKIRTIFTTIMMMIFGITKKRKIIGRIISKGQVWKWLVSNTAMQMAVPKGKNK